MIRILPLSQIALDGLESLLIDLEELLRLAQLTGRLVVAAKVVNQALFEGDEAEPVVSPVEWLEIAAGPRCLIPSAIAPIQICLVHLVIHWYSLEYVLVPLRWRWPGPAGTMLRAHVLVNQLFGEAIEPVGHGHHRQREVRRSSLKRIHVLCARGQCNLFQIFRIMHFPVANGNQVCLRARSNPQQG